MQRGQENLRGVRLCIAQAACAGLIAMGCASPALSQEFGPPPDAPVIGTVDVLLGVGVARRASYLGSDETRLRALPLISARWRNGWFAGIGGIGYRLTGDGGLSGGLRVSLDTGRRESASSALQGLGDVPRRPEAGAFVDWRFLPTLGVGASVRYGSGKDHNGLLGELSLRSSLALGGAHRLFGGLGATFANRQSAQSLFGITEEQAANSTYAVYSPKGGLRDVSATAGYGYSITPQWHLMTGLTVRSLLGDAKDSPLTRKATSTGIHLVVSYRL